MTWETIRGSAHTVTEHPAERLDYPEAVPGDVVLTLEAHATAGTGPRIGHRVIVTGRSLADVPGIYGHTLDRMTRDLDEWAPA